MAKALFLKEDNPFLTRQVLGKPLIYFPVKEAKKVIEQVYVSGFNVDFAEEKDFHSVEEIFAEMEEDEKLLFAYPSFIGIFAEDIVDALNKGSCLFIIEGEIAGGVIKKGEKIENVKKKVEIEGVKIRDNFSFVDAVHLIRFRIIEEAMLKGAIILDPYTTWIDEDVEFSPGVTVEPNVILKGWIKLEEDVVIKSFTYMENGGKEGRMPEKPMVVRKGASIGPFSRLRLDSEIGEGVFIGNFVEVKKSKIGKNVKAQHLTYIGDAEIGEDSNIGAGTITCNYDGVKKNKTKIGSRVFVGSGVELVAPVEVEDDVYIAAGSTITERVPRFSLAIARARQINKEGWVLKKRKEWQEKSKES